MFRSRYIKNKKAIRKLLNIQYGFNKYVANGIKKAFVLKFYILEDYI